MQKYVSMIFSVEKRQQTIFLIIYFLLKDMMNILEIVQIHINKRAAANTNYENNEQLSAI
jgi:hypothetical protein